MFDDGIPVEGLLEVEQDEGTICVRILSSDKQRMVSIVVRKDKVLAIETIRQPDASTKVVFSLDHQAFSVD